VLSTVGLVFFDCLPCSYAVRCHACLQHHLAEQVLLPLHESSSVLASDLLAGTLYQVTGVRLVADWLMILLLLLQMSSSQAEVLQTVETCQVLSELRLQEQVWAHVVLDCVQDCCQIRLACHCHCRCCSHSPHMSRYQTLPHSLQYFLELLPGSNAPVGRANKDLANTGGLVNDDCVAGRITCAVRLTGVCHHPLVQTQPSKKPWNAATLTRIVDQLCCWAFKIEEISCAQIHDLASNSFDLRWHIAGACDI